MRIPSGKTDAYLYFVALDATDPATFKTGLSAFTVYRSRNGGAAALYTTPTIAEISAANMPGLYALLIDEDTTIASTSDSEEMTLRITCAGMAAVTRTVELYRRDVTTGRTLAVDANSRADAAIGDAGAAAAALAHLDADVTSRLATASYTAPPTAAAIRAEVDANSSKLDVAVGTRLAANAYTAPSEPPAASTIAEAVRAELGVELGRVDAAVSTRLAGSAYTEPTTPPAADAIASAVRTELATELGRIDAATSTRLASGAYTAPDNDALHDLVDDERTTALALMSAIGGISIDPSGVASAVVEALAEDFDALPAATRDAIFAREIEAGLSFLAHLRVVGAIHYGPGNDLAGEHPAFHDPSGAHVRITAHTVDGVRSAVEIDAT